jgi:hypothetical protein
VVSLGQSSSNYLTGGVSPWIGNSNAFLAFGGGQQLRIGSGTGTIPHVTVASNGNVGIGTAAQSARLHIVPTNAFPSGFQIDRLGTGAGNGQVWNFKILNAAATDVVSLGQSSSNYLTGGTTPWIGNSNAFLTFGGAQQLRIGSGTGSTPWVTIAGSNGNVGIGTASPGFRLDVQSGQINASGGLCMGGTVRRHGRKSRTESRAHVPQATPSA